MKKLLLTLTLLLTLGFAASAAGTDVLTNASLNNGTDTNSGGYKEFTSGSFESGAQYAGKVNFVKNKTNYYFVLNNSNTSGSDIVTVKSGGLASSVKITWSTIAATSAGREVKVYGKHTAYTSGDKAQGTELGSATKGDAATVTIELSDKSYEYIAINAASAVNLDEIEITWIDGTITEPEQIELAEENLVIKAGDQVIEGEEVELDANTTLTFSYNTDNANADITYSYSTDATNYTEGNSYTFDGNDVTLLVKAASENEVEKMLTITKKYPTECPEPVFSVADGAEVYAGQVISVSAEGAEELYLEVNDDLLEGTSYTVSGEVGSTITLHALASVTGKNGSINSEKTITVTVAEATEATFDFSEDTYGLTPITDSNKYEADQENPVTEISSGIVTINFSGEKYRLWSNDKTLRVQSGSDFTISVPEEYYITEIRMTGTSASPVDKGTFETGKWSNDGGFYSSVKFSPSSTTKIKTITVKYAKLKPTVVLSNVEINHGTVAGVLTVGYTFEIANYNDGEVAVKATIVGMENITFAEVEAPAAAPAREAAGNKVVNGTLKAKDAALKGEQSLIVNVVATLDGKEIYNVNHNEIKTTGIEDVTVDGNEAAEYFNLQGVRVAQPEAGQVYIVRRGAKATKELVK